MSDPIPITAMDQDVSLPQILLNGCYACNRVTDPKLIGCRRCHFDKGIASDNDVLEKPDSPHISFA